jgi:hypothetical protein
VEKTEKPIIPEKKDWLKTGVKYILIFTAILISGLLLSSILLSAFGNKIARKLVDEMQKEIQTESHIGEIDVSILPYFPSAAIRLKQFLLKDINGNVLLEAEQIAFKISLWQLFFGKAVLENVSFQKGALTLLRNNDGKWNFDEIFRKDLQNEQQSSSFALKIKRADIKGIEFLYGDLQGNSEVSLYLIEASLSLHYEEPMILIDAKGKTIVDRIGSAEALIVENKTMEFDIKGQFDLDEQRYAFAASKIILAKVPFQFSGTIFQQKDASEFDLQLGEDALPLNHVIQLLPESSLGFLRQLDIQGQSRLSLQIKGTLSEKQVPDIIFDFAADDATLENKRLGMNLSKLKLSASGEIKTFTNKWRIHLHAQNGKYRPLKWKMEWLDAARPQFTMEMDGDFPNALLGLFLGSAMDKAEGQIAFSKVQLSGNPNNPDAFRAEGRIYLSKNFFRWEGENFHFPSVDLQISRNEIRIDSLFAEFLQSDFDIRGRIHNISALFSSKSSIKPHLDLIAFSDRFHWNLIEQFSEKRNKTLENQSEKDSTIIRSNSNWKNWSCLLSWSVQRMDIQKLNFQSLLLQGQLRDAVLLADISTQAFDGKVQGKVKWTLLPHPELHITASADTIRIEQLFGQFENFGQQTLTDANISGAMDARIFAKIPWDEDWNIIENQIYVLSSMRINEGYLKNFPLLYDFSKYMKIEDLRNVRFAEMHNYIEIEQRNIYIPLMTIQSNALNLEVLGTHTFDQNTDYAIRINAGQVLTNKFKKHNPSLEPMAIRRNGWFNIYYRIFGHLDHLQYKSDRQKILKDMKQSEQKKRQLEQKLLNIFGPGAVFNVEEKSDSNTFSEEEEYIQFEN